MAYFSEKLPSNRHKTVKLKVYTLKDAAVISSLNPKLKERLITSFLDVLQTGEDIINPATEMTVQDRRSLLFKYALVSLEEETLASPEKFTTPINGKNETFSVSMLEFGQKAKNRLRDSVEIESEFLGKRIKITPLMGVHAEQLEMFDNKLTAIEKKHGPESDEFHSMRVKKEIHEVACQFTLVGEGDQDEDQKEKDKKWLEGLPINDYLKFTQLLARKQAEIDHGVDFRYTVNLSNKEEQETILLPFCLDHYIQRV